MNNVLYFASKFLKRIFKKKPCEIGSIRYGPIRKYLLKTVQHVLYLASKYLKQNFKKKPNEIGSVQYGLAMKCLLLLVE